MYKDDKYLYQNLYYNDLTNRLTDVVNNAIGRNVVVFDKKADNGELTARMLALLINFDRNIGWLYLLVRAEDRISLESELMLHGMDLHLNIVYLEGRYNQIKEYYLSYPGTTLAGEDKEMVLLVDNTFTKGLIGSY